MKGLGIIVAGIVVGWFFWWTFILPAIVYLWNIYDAYTS